MSFKKLAICSLVLTGMISIDASANRRANVETIAKSYAANKSVQNLNRIIESLNIKTSIRNSKQLSEGLAKAEASGKVKKAEIEAGLKNLADLSAKIENGKLNGKVSENAAKAIVGAVADTISNFDGNVSDFAKNLAFSDGLQKLVNSCSDNCKGVERFAQLVSKNVSKGGGLDSALRSSVEDYLRGQKAQNESKDITEVEITDTEVDEWIKSFNELC